MNRIVRALRATAPGRHARLALLALVFCLVSASLPRTVPTTAAAAITPEAALVRLITAPQLQAAWFAPSFLAQAPLSEVEQVVAGLTAALGRFERVTPRPDGSYLLVFQRGTVVAQIALDKQGRIIGLFFRPPTLAVGGSPDKALAAFRALPGHVSVLVTTNGQVTAALDPARRLAVGSAFKLAVLAALQEQIAAGKLSWSTVVTLRKSDKSLPSGLLQDWPVGSHLTVETLASLMISQSDNTAADTLIHLVGRAAIAPLIPARDRPILTTREAFVLKDPRHAALRARYLHGDETQRLAVLREADTLPLPSVGIFARGPVAPRLEWFFSLQELCGLMSRVHTLPLMGINPGVATARGWAHVAYKGGSEPGVLNLTTMLTTRSGTTYCVAATWNNTAVLDEGRFEVLYAGLLATLKH